MAISPCAVPSAGTSAPSASITRTDEVTSVPTPWRALIRACSAAGRPSHSLRQSQISEGP